jgi:hypothetical protein
MTWNAQFMELYHRCVRHYRGGNADFESYYAKRDREFLRSIGYKPRELFDFVEDFVDEGEPDETTALLVAGVRRDYLHIEQDGVRSDHEITAADLPTFGDLLDGIPYLPRILTKARAKLRGELDPDLMYGCGGDRKFLREHGGIHPADFLRAVWRAGNDEAAMIGFVRAHAAG